MSKSAVKIGLDLRGLDPEFKAHSKRGTGRYVKELTSRLLNGTSNQFQFLGLSRKEIGLNPIQHKILNNLPRGKVTFESQICLRKNLKKLNCNFIHFFSHGDAPSYPLTPQIVTILDLIPLKFPDLYQSGPLNLRFKLARFLENHSAQAAKGIITISQASKQDIIDILNIPENRIAVTHLGVDPQFFENHQTGGLDTSQVREEFKLPSHPLALYVGGLDARKNVDFLINVVSEINKNTNLLCTNESLHLAIVGDFKNEKHLPALKQQIQALGLDSQIHFLGYVSNSNLRKLYKASDIFIFPSLYEGFGLPVLEAMASGIPLLAGDNSCMREVLGNDNFLLPDNDLNTWVREVIGVINSKRAGDSVLNEEVLFNQKRARTFTWENTYHQTLNAYTEFCGRCGK